MTVTKDKIEDLINKYGKNKENSGTTEVQIAILTERIRNITEHLKNNKKDNSGRRGLVILVAKRRKLLNYIKKIDVNRYKKTIEELNIRK